MGILRVGIETAKAVLEDQWREYFYCSALDTDVLVTKGQAKQTKRGFNKKKTDNIITNGSIIVVNEGQCMIIVDQGAVVEICAEAGEFLYDTSTEPSIFYGDLGENIVNTFKQFGKRVSFAGEPPKDQRIYYFNTKDILGNKYGTANPIPFRVVDKNIGLDIDISIRCHGEYAYHIVDPILFYKNICGNVEEDYTRDNIDSQLKSDLLTALQPAFGKLSDMGIRYSAITNHTMEMADVLNEILSEKWGERFGIAISTIGVNSVKASEEDEAMIKELQKTSVYRNPGMAAANLTMAQAEAMKAAASNTATGPMFAFAGMNMANQQGGFHAQELFQIQQEQQTAQMQSGQIQPNGNQMANGSSSENVANSWNCSCGKANTGKFCIECGAPKPANNFWVCSCGTQNKGKFCMECGAKKPAGIPQYKCDKCGWEPEDPTKPPKFCPECGDVFDDGDIK